MHKVTPLLVAHLISRCWHGGAAHQSPSGTARAQLFDQQA